MTFIIAVHFLTWTILIRHSSDILTTLIFKYFDGPFSTPLIPIIPINFKIQSKQKCIKRLTASNENERKIILKLFVFPIEILFNSKFWYFFKKMSI